MAYMMAVILKSITRADEKAMIRNLYSRIPYPARTKSKTVLKLSENMCASFERMLKSFIS